MIPDHADLRAKAEAVDANACAGAVLASGAAVEAFDAYLAAASPSVVLGLIDELAEARALLVQVSAAWDAVTSADDASDHAAALAAVRGHDAVLAEIRDALGKGGPS